MHLGVVQEEEIVLSGSATRQVRERCGGAAPAAPNWGGSTGESSTSEGSAGDSCVGDSSRANRGAGGGVASSALRSHDRSVSDTSPNRVVPDAQQEDR